LAPYHVAAGDAKPGNHAWNTPAYRIPLATPDTVSTAIA